MPLEPARGGFSHPLEALQVGPAVQRRILDAGDRQRRGRQPFAWLVERAQQVFGDTRQTCLERLGHGSIVARTHASGLSTVPAAGSSFSYQLPAQLPAFSFQLSAVRRCTVALW